MRGLLVAAQGILAGVNQGDMQRIITAARSAGMAGKGQLNPGLIAKLPLKFKALDMSMRHEMDDIAKAAEDGAPSAVLLKMASDTLTKCIACHTAWQLKASR